MIITRDTFGKFKDAYVRALAITLKEKLSDCQKQKDDYLWNKLNELYQKPIDFDKLHELANKLCPLEGFSNAEEGFIDEREDIEDSWVDGFKAGYRKAMEE